MLESLMIENGSLSEIFPFLHRVKNDEEAEKEIEKLKIKEMAISILVGEAEKPLKKKKEISQLISFFKDGEEKKYFGDVLHNLVEGNILYIQGRKIYANTTEYAKERIASDDKLYKICGLI